jgi:putative photosynthetic complex assembly protein 2
MATLSHPAVAALCALFVWWFGTGVILYVAGLAPRTFRWSALCATILFAVSLWGLADSSADVSLAGAYRAFIWAIVLWGMLEVGFLLGVLTGPSTEPCPNGCTGWRRVVFAIRAILYHELALLASGALVLMLTWAGPNRVGLWTLLLLWTMRLSAKLNLFLGVPILNDQFLPVHLDYLKSFFTRKPVNPLFPFAVAASSVFALLLVFRAFADGATAFETTGFILLAALLALAVLEHLFMVVPLPIDALWSWGMRSRANFARSKIAASATRKLPDQ